MEQEKLKAANNIKKEMTAYRSSLKELVNHNTVSTPYRGVVINNDMFEIIGDDIISIIQDLIDAKELEFYEL